MRILIGRVDEKGAVPARNVVFQPNLVIGDSVAVPKAIRRQIP
jgi:hypothetical protein